MLMPAITWLHLSDWHQKGPDFDRKVVRDALIKDIRNRAAINPSLAKIDLIIFSGDIAFGGLEPEYKTAKEQLFDPILKATDLTPAELFFVPGNHDLNRDVVSVMLPADLQKPFQSSE